MNFKQATEGRAARPYDLLLHWLSGDMSSELVRFWSRSQHQDPIAQALASYLNPRVLIGGLLGILVSFFGAMSTVWLSLQATKSTEWIYLYTSSIVVATIGASMLLCSWRIQFWSNRNIESHETWDQYDNYYSCYLCFQKWSGLAPIQLKFLSGNALRDEAKYLLLIAAQNFLNAEIEHANDHDGGFSATDPLNEILIGRCKVLQRLSLFNGNRAALLAEARKRMREAEVSSSGTTSSETVPAS